MRSDLVFGAMTNVPNRYLLARLAAKAARTLHKPGTRMQDTANEVLARFSSSDPIACEQVSRKPPAGQLCLQAKLPLIPHESTVVTIPSASERSNALLEAARVLGA